ncbi:class I SAM-dependent methyltransferase [bacterium]|nr:class I SAM-dependent methyltransferase [bacterium]
MSAPIYTEFKAFENFLDTIDEANLDQYRTEFFDRIDHIADLIDDSDDKNALKDDFFKRCQLIEDSVMHQRTRNKPLGYAGDFKLIDWIYTGRCADEGHGNLFDRLFHSYEAAEAVRNRKSFFIKKCIDLAHSTEQRIDVLDLACGSCRDVVETFEISQNGHNMFFHCVDQEPQAIAYARQLLEELPHSDHVQLDEANVFKIKSDRQYDLIWSAGLFDYLDRRTIVLLLKRVWRHLKDGGRIIFGNFGPYNPTRKGMELIGQWYLIHRSAQELVEIVRETGLPVSDIEVESEPNGVNLFCVITK